jgi:hypothetical protein
MSNLTYYTSCPKNEFKAGFYITTGILTAYTLATTTHYVVKSIWKYMFKSDTCMRLSGNKKKECACNMSCVCSEKSETIY